MTLAYGRSISELDRWAMKHYGVPVGLLPEEYHQELSTHILGLAEADKEFWRDRDRRMDDEQDMVDLITSQRETRKTDEEEAQNSEVYILPDPYILVDKMASMIQGAGLTIEAPSYSLTDTVATQQVENMCYWILEQLISQHAFGLRGHFIRDVAQDAVLRGWMAALVMPDSSSLAFPWTIELEDPKHVYPRNTRRGLIRVTRQYTIPVLEAREEFPETEELLGEYDEDDTVDIIGYFDSIYHAILVSTGLPQSKQGSIVKYPTPHGVRDFIGNPVVPWVIVTPKGGRVRKDRAGKIDTSRVGVSILYAMRETWEHLSKLTSQVLTGVARSDNPPILRYIDPSRPNTESVNLGPGGRNYAVYNRERVEILDLAPNPGNLNVALQILTDARNKTTLPAVFWGEAGAVTSGYGVGLLRGAANDIMIAYAEAIQLFMEMLLQRALETYMYITGPMIGALQIVGRQNERLAVMQVSPEVVQQTGVMVDVKLRELTPQDRAALTASLVAMVTSGIHSRYSARKEAGIKDPVLEGFRVAAETLYGDPEIMREIGPLAASMSDDELLRRALALKQQKEAAALQQAAMTPLPTEAVPLELQQRAGQPPGAQNPIDAQERAINDVIARLSGGSLPAGG